MPNRLRHATSPYLLQHAGNPVHWQPWDETALVQARSEGKLLIISIGYSACHWCHVMEHESFKDDEVAAVMNAHYISIKVDREERPDIDQVYMDACTLVTGRGGWPLNAIALPDGRPVYAGTYFPKDTWLRILRFYHELYTTQRPKLEEQADRITEGLARPELLPESGPETTPAIDLLHRAFANWRPRLDLTWGGRHGAPKFPMPANWDFLLAYHHLSGEAEAGKAVHITLTRMAWGGIFDQIGGGFARYSTDAEWHVPHFEKMLYDNAQLISLYSKAWQHNPDLLWREVVYGTVDFVLRELQDDSGGFYCALDADSEGEEGLYYVWKKAEIDKALGSKAEAFCRVFNITETGNWEHGRNVLMQTDILSVHAVSLGVSEEELKTLLQASRQKLLALREKRIRPGLDDKVITSWNALMLKGLTDAWFAFGEQRFLDAALRNAAFLRDTLMQDGHRLHRSYKQGKTSIPAFLDDYALLAEAFFHLYRATLDPAWLHHADGLAAHVEAHFRNPETGLFFYTSDEGEALVARKMELSDNVIPASNSVMAHVLYELGTYFHRPAQVDFARQMLARMTEQTVKEPPFFSNWARLLLREAFPPFEVAVMGPDARTLLAELGRHYLPDALLLGATQPSDLPLLQGKWSDTETRIFVCRNQTCRKPVHTVAEALEEMAALRSQT